MNVRINISVSVNKAIELFNRLSKKRNVTFNGEFFTENFSQLIGTHLCGVLEVFFFIEFLTKRNSS